jgi:hypothetical protein
MKVLIIIECSFSIRTFVRHLIGNRTVFNKIEIELLRKSSNIVLQS